MQRPPCTVPPPPARISSTPWPFSFIFSIFKRRPMPAPDLTTGWTRVFNSSELSPGFILEIPGDHFHAFPTPTMRLIDIAILMRQELDEIVADAKDAVEGGYLEDPLEHIQSLVKDWDEAYTAAGFTEGDHFQAEKRAAEAQRLRAQSQQG
jgi:hypothetical protein